MNMSRPLTRHSGTLSATGGEGWGEGVRFMGKGIPGKAALLSLGGRRGRRIHRRDFLKHGAAALGLLSLHSPALRAADPPSSPFAQRGYYITFMRMPTYGLAQWKQILDAIHADGGNLLLLWMGGAFRSKQFPVTWKFNEAHENVRRDFTRELIAHAHARGLKVLLAFTPFAYDGVNQYPLEHPELKAMGRDGKPVGKAGIFCWGWNLCPSQPEAQRFMLDYTREMFFEFYPAADGLMIEASDYAICHCPGCGGRYFEKEFQFVRAISNEVWAKKRDSMIVVYPHYFSGANVPGFGVTAATQAFDPRWTLFFTPHSAHLDAKLIRQAKSSLWSDDAPALHDPAAIQHGAKRARDAGVTGYVPSLEAFSFIATEPEEDQRYLVGQRQVPLGFGWLKPDEQPYGELPMRVNRVAYREFSRQPDLPFDEFKRHLGRELFGDDATPQAIDDALQLQHYFAHSRTWCQASPIVSPERVRAMKRRGELKTEKVADYKAAHDHLRQIAERHRAATNTGRKELHRIAQWVLDQWAGNNAELLAPPDSKP